MKDIIISKHAFEQMGLRNISEADVRNTVFNPEHIIAQDGLKVYHRIIQVEGKSYLFRIFINDLVDPNIVVTVYRTSKISKYYEGEI